MFVFPVLCIRGGAEQKIRKYLIDNNYIECIIQLPDNLLRNKHCDLYYGSQKSKVDNQTLFIDASKEFVKSTNSNKLGMEHQANEPDNIQNILNAYINRKTEKHFTALVKQEDIENADYNLSVSTYVESEDTREAIDIAVLNKQISVIVQRENTLRAEIDAIIAEIEGGVMYEIIRCVIKTNNNRLCTNRRLLGSRKLKTGNSKKIAVGKVALNYYCNNYGDQRTFYSGEDLFCIGVNEKDCQH